MFRRYLSGRLLSGAFCPDTAELISTVFTNNSSPKYDIHIPLCMIANIYKYPYENNVGRDVSSLAYGLVQIYLSCTVCNRF